MLHEVKVYFDSSRLARLGFRWTAKCKTVGCWCGNIGAQGDTAEQAQRALGYRLVERQEEPAPRAPRRTA